MTVHLQSISRPRVAQFEEAIQLVGLLDAIIGMVQNFLGLLVDAGVKES